MAKRKTPTRKTSTRKHRYTKVKHNKKHRTIKKNRIQRAGTGIEHLTKKDKNKLLNLYVLNSATTRDITYIKNQLDDLEFTPGYINCFGDSEATSLYEMAAGKLQCYLKYGEPF